MIRKINKKLRSLLPKTRKSNPISKLLRPIFEKNRFKSFLGLQIAGFAAMVGIFTYPYPTHAFDYSVIDGQYIDAESVEELSTETTFQFPLESTHGISQYFSRYHPGIDARANRGAAIYPIAKGEVIETGYLTLGYGHYVLISHQGEFVSLYAHMDNIAVVEGEEVERNTVIGNVGMTGWTTGSHLHLEVLRDGVYINPLSLFQIPSN